MFFRVENLGPLREAEVDLSKGLILLTGPNNTGKTYLAWSVYGLFRNPSAPKTLRPILDELLASPRQSINVERIREVWPSVLEEVGQRFGQQLHHCFGAPKSMFANAQTILRAGPIDPEHFFSHTYITSLGKGLWLSITMRPNRQLEFQIHTIDQDRKARSLVEFNALPDDTRKTSLPDILDSFQYMVFSGIRGCILLPAERTAVDVFAKELLSARNNAVQKFKDAELDGAVDVSPLRQIGRYPWPIEDSLEIASDLSVYSNRESSFADLAKELESLLGGTVSLSDSGEFRFATNQHADAPIAIHLCSSVVKSLVSLVFYLRHQAREGALLMLDEPELNLHPDNQRLVTRILAKAVNRGLRVIMSTHSDYILREINNLILLSRDEDGIKELREKYGYSETELLSPEKIGPYLFRNGGCEAIPVTEDGFTVKTIEDEINKLNEISQAIYMALL